MGWLAAALAYFPGPPYASGGAQRLFEGGRWRGAGGWLPLYRLLARCGGGGAEEQALGGVARRGGAAEGDLLLPLQAARQVRRQPLLELRGETDERAAAESAKFGISTDLVHLPALKVRPRATTRTSRTVSPDRCGCNANAVRPALKAGDTGGCPRSIKLGLQVRKTPASAFYSRSPQECMGQLASFGPA